jgi:hypothetical protein
MILAVDSSVLLAIFCAEPGGERWLDTLVDARRAGRLTLCEIVYAEIAPALHPAWSSTRRCTLSVSSWNRSEPKRRGSPG